MRIAYIAPYYGPGVLERRQIRFNPSLANSTKLALITELLRQHGHSIEVLAPAEVFEQKPRFYPAYVEPRPFDFSVPVFYASCLPIPRVAGLWSSVATLRLLRQRHRRCKYEAVIIWNLKDTTVVCAHHAIRRMRVPVFIQYEDDSNVDVWGRPMTRSLLYRHYVETALNEASGCLACSPRLLSQLPSQLPRMLLRGIVGRDIVQSPERTAGEKRNWVVFSGTHDPQKGVAQLINAWSRLDAPGWELHITGEGAESTSWRKQAEDIPGIRFHGLVSRPELVRIICQAKICVNPHDLSALPGNLFAFKIVEYLAAGAHVLTTPMGVLERELEAGITYLPDNDPDSIAAALMLAIRERRWQKSAAADVLRMYSPDAVSASLQTLLSQQTPASTRAPDLAAIGA
jgi:glycosyltransferase involved in cell wall biosynthesis